MHHALHVLEASALTQGSNFCPESMGIWYL